MPDTTPLAPSPALCRSCLSESADAGQRCRVCGSPRLVRHPELRQLAIAHIDCDAFYAAIEKRDDPSLADRPVIVGGGRRGVVATACYIARIRGVRSAMPMYQALKLCPEAVVIPPDMAKYSAVGRAVRAMMLELTPLVEPLSIDEAFLDLSGTERLHRAPPAVLLARLALRIEQEIGITVSVGLSFAKFLAKLASDLDKPRGFSVIGRDEALSFLAPRPVGFIWGVGKAMQERLARDGIRTIGQLQSMDEADLMRRYGAMGQRLSRLSRAQDDRRVDPAGEARSVSAETTFDTDISDGARLAGILRTLSEKVSAGLKRRQLAGRTVTLKLKTGDFRLRTRSRTFAGPTQLADRIWRAGADLLARETDGTAFRLIGIGVSELTPALAEINEEEDDLVDPAAARRARAERAMDRIRTRFGDRAVELAMTLGPNPGPKRPGPGSDGSS
jgi:DNA polymerase-4